MSFTEGDKYPTWLSAEPDGMSTIVFVRPYKGAYPKAFTHVLTLTAPRTRAGVLEMSVRAPDRPNMESACTPTSC